MVDIHSHIIPGIDDGSEDMENTISMLETAERSDTEAIIATPHYFRGRFETPFGKVVELVEDLRAEAAARGISIDIYPGQEVLLHRDVVELYRKGIVRGLNNTRYILVETDMGSYSESYLDTLYELKVMGAVPIIAHPERYGYILEDVNRINPFIDEGCLFQINSSSITGVFGKTVQKTANILIEQGICHFIASDAHTNHKRTTGIKEAFELAKKINKSVAADAEINGRLLIKDEDIKTKCSRINIKKSIFSFLR
ncbi:MAG: tyrosine-protein phosphatase [Clostridiaceae bacterium]